MLRHVLDREVKASRFLNQVAQGRTWEGTATLTTTNTKSHLKTEF